MPQMNVNRQIHAILKQLSKASGVPITKLLEQWTSALQEILDDTSFTKLGVTSYRVYREGDYGKIGHPVVVTGVVPLLIGKKTIIEIIEQDSPKGD